MLEKREVTSKLAITALLKLIQENESFIIKEFVEMGVSNGMKNLASLYE